MPVCRPCCLVRSQRRWVVPTMTFWPFVHVDAVEVLFEKLQEVLSDSSVQAMLICISSLPVFSEEMGRAYHDVLDLLRVWKQLKYLLDLPKSQLVIQAEI